MRRSLDDLIRRAAGRVRIEPEAETRREIVLAGREVAYTLVRSARRRTIGLTIAHEGLRVSAPPRVSDRRIETVLFERAGWILGKLDKWAAMPAPQTRRFETGETFPWRGMMLTLEVRDLPRGVRTRVRREDGCLMVEIDPQTEGVLRENAIRSGLKRWYRREAEAAFAPLIARHAAALGKPAPKLLVREQKRRWGSCDPKGVIRMSWRLIGADDALIDYVCAHEVAHLVRADHSPAFWAVVEALVPGWKALRKRLNDEAGAITPF